MADMQFELTWQYADQPDGITLPVGLSVGERITRTYAKVDTGSEFCVFSP
jgi:hypothetical protein